MARSCFMTPSALIWPLADAPPPLMIAPLDKHDSTISSLSWRMTGCPLASEGYSAVQYDNTTSNKCLQTGLLTMDTSGAPIVECALDDRTKHLARTTAMRFLPPRPNADGDTLAYFFSPTDEICGAT